MKSVGMYAILLKNSIQKTTWKQYEIEKMDEQINFIFAILLYIMEQSLKDEACTMDDIGAYIDSMNMRCFKKSLSYENCKELGEFIINIVLCDEGRAMYFDGFDFEQRAYKIMNIRFVANRIIYVDQDVRRTSYYLTEDGYSFLLSTLEIENNMKLTIHEMIFKMHLERATYDKAVDEVKNIFNLLRIQLQKIEEAMGKIRRNALNYSVTDYKEILEENLETISDTKKKFLNYKKIVKNRAQELEEKNISIQKLDHKEEENLKNLRTIETYLSRSIDEHQKILNSHFDLKILYTKELEELSQMALIQRFHLRTKLYDEVLKHPQYLEELDFFLRPLFQQQLPKTYNLNKSLEMQKSIRKKQIEEEDELLSFDEEAWQEEKERLLREKIRKYENCLKVILRYAGHEKGISLKELKETYAKEREDLIPSVEIFREVIIELLKHKFIDIHALKKERSEYLLEVPTTFELNDTLLRLIEENPAWSDIKSVEVYRILDGSSVVFENVESETGIIKTIRCSNVSFRAS